METGAKENRRTGVSPFSILLLPPSRNSKILVYPGSKALLKIKITKRTHLEVCLLYCRSTIYKNFDPPSFKKRTHFIAERAAVSAAFRAHPADSPVFWKPVKVSQGESSQPCGKKALTNMQSIRKVHLIRA